ncbi:MAG TPA: recombinase family protein [Tepidisphaeraceae bacterium]
MESQNEQDHTLAGDVSHPPQSPSSNGSPEDELLPHRPPRRPRRGRNERGMPADEDIKKLATVYLTKQRELWPELARTGELPEPTDAVLDQMVMDFKSRHLVGHVPSPPPKAIPNAAEVFAGYLRYSDEDSDPRSIDDQLAAVLPAAHARGHFIPWSYVFADAAWSGLDRERRGYKRAGAVVTDLNRRVGGLWIYDFSRGGRQPREWFALADRFQHRRKNLLSANDGFELASEHGRTMLHAYAMYQEIHVTGLRRRVRDGLDGAHDRDTSTGRPALGYGLVPKLDHAGRPVTGKDGEPLKTRAIHAPTMKEVIQIFERYGFGGWSKGGIGRDLAAREVDGSSSWDESNVDKVLRRPIYLGISIRNRYRYERDPETNRLKQIENPRKEWKVRRVPHLRPAKMTSALARAVWRRLKTERDGHPNTGRKPSRNERQATTVVSALLRCGYCKKDGEQRELTLTRSSEKYHEMGCHNGANGKHHCKLTTSKSVRIIFKCLLDYVRNQLLTSDTLGALVDYANEAVAEELAKPLVDVTPLKAAMAQCRRDEAKLVKLLKGEEDDALLDALKDELRSTRSRINDLSRDISKAEAKRASPTQPLSMDDLLPFLEELSVLLSKHIPQVALALRQLLGDVVITQERYPDKERGGKWIATFVPRLGQSLAQRINDDPKARKLLQDAGNWMTEPVTLVIDHVPKYEELTPQVKELMRAVEAQGRRASINGMAKALNQPYSLIRDTVQYIVTGSRPRTKPPGKRTGSRTGTVPAYIEKAAEAARLFDEQGWNGNQVAAALGVDRSTADRAYAYYHRDQIAATVRAGRPARRDRSRRIGKDNVDRIVALAAEGKGNAEIASIVGCGKRTVYRVLADATKNSQAA